MSNIFKNIFITFLLIIPSEFLYSQNCQIGLHFGQTKFDESDKYLKSIIDGPYNISDKNYFESGYIFNMNSYSTKANFKIGISAEYNLSKTIYTFVDFSYISVTSNGDCHVSPLLSGGLAARNTRFEIKSSIYSAQLGAGFNLKIRHLIPYLSLKIIYDNIINNDVELLDVNEDFIRYSHKYTFNTANSIGFGLGFGIKIPVLRRFQLLASAEYDDLNLIYTEVDNSLIIYSFSLGILFDISLQLTSGSNGKKGGF